MTNLPLNLRPDLAAKLDEAVRRIVEVADPQLVILFGSYAEGQQRPGSDLDLLVVAETESRVELGVKLRRELWPLLRPLPFDLVVYTPQAWERARHLRGFMPRDADRKGVRLYEAG